MAVCLEFLEPARVDTTQIPLNLNLLITKLQKTEAQGQVWEAGWEAFFWHIGGDQDTWERYVHEPWVQPGILTISKTSKIPKSPYLEAVTSARFLELGLQESSPICQVGNLRLLSFLHTHSLLLWDPSSTLIAAQEGHVHILEFCLTHRLLFCTETALLCDQVKVIQWYLDSRLSLDYWSIMDRAAKKGNLAIVELLHKRAFPGALFWTDQALCHAASSGHKHILQFAIEQNLHLPWDPKLPFEAVRSNQVEIVRFLLEHGCPFPSQIIFQIILGGNLELWIIALQQGWHLDFQAISILNQIKTTKRSSFLQEYTKHT